MKPEDLDKLEQQVVNERLKHEITSQRANEVLKTFRRGNEYARRMIVNYKTEDERLRREPH